LSLDSHWKIKTLPTFDDWFKSLSLPEKEDVLAGIYLLEDQGANLSRPYADTLKGSKFKNMKELRVQHKGSLIVLFMLLIPKDRAYKDRAY